MININNIAEKISVSRFDTSKFSLPKIDLTSFDLSKVDLPKFDLPKFDLPKFDLPKFDLPKVDVSTEAARVAGFARDAAYVGLGAAVVTVQAVDQRRRELTDQVAGQFRKAARAA